jgi:hypothetical protein
MFLKKFSNTLQYLLIHLKTSLTEKGKKLAFLLHNGIPVRGRPISISPKNLQ